MPPSPSRAASPPPAAEGEEDEGDRLRGVAGEDVRDDLLDVGVPPAPFLDRAHDGGEVVVRQDHVRRLFRDVRSRDPHRDADVGLFQRGGVVHPLPPPARGPPPPWRSGPSPDGISRPPPPLRGAGDPSSPPGRKTSGPAPPPRPFPPARFRAGSRRGPARAARRGPSRRSPGRFAAAPPP